MENEDIHLFSVQMGHVLPKEYFYKRLFFNWVEEMEKNRMGEKFN